MSQDAGEQNSGEKQGSGGSRSRLVARLLAASSNLPAFIKDLLTTQAVVVAGTEAAGFLIERVAAQPTAEGDDAKLPAETLSLRLIEHIRPDSSPPEVRKQAIEAFTDIIKPCIQRNSDGVIEVGSQSDATESQFCLVTLLRNEGELVAVSAVITRARDAEQAQQRLMSMQLVAGYFDLFTLKRTAEQSRVIAQSHQHVLQLVSAVSTATGFQAAANNFCNELALRTGATRVSLGWLKGTNIKIKALSHTEQFDKKQELITQLEAVMEECADQEEPVFFDPEGKQTTQNVVRAAANFGKSTANSGVMSLPLRKLGEIVGVVTLEFDQAAKLGPQAAQGLAVAVDLLAPQLHDRHENDRWLITKTGISIRENAKVVMGPKHMLAKLICTSLLALLLFSIFYKPMAHVSAPFQFAAIEKRSIVAPFDGYIKEVKVKPGTSTALVKKGDVLLVMDTNELTQKMAISLSNANAKLREAEKNLADKSKVAEYKQAMQDRETSLREVDYYKGQIERATVRAPIDGEVIKGDLEDKIGAQVRPTDVLFEIAQRDSLRAELSVNERDIQLIQNQKSGTLATTSLPTEKFPFKIERIVPMGEAKEGQNTFKVYARLDRESANWPKDAKSDQGWYPGMEGEARIEDQRRSVMWIWTHRFVDFVRLSLWI